MKATVLRGAAIAATLLLGTAVHAASNIDPDNSLAWGENIGWVNLYANGTDGVVVTDNYLSGFAWSSTMGWIYFGGVPSNSTTYSQSGADVGVNNDGAGNLTGWGWGENIGWINFDTTSTGGSQVTIDGSGWFHGMAWGENVGWINMESGSGVRMLSTTTTKDWSMY